MSQKIPIYIPTLISDINYNPAKVYPRLYFYNGKVQCEPYYFERKAASGSAIIVNTQLDSFPYVDHYNVVSGSFPTDGSKSLLFQNEEPVYGSAPSSSLYSEYWETYINLLYNPLTRLINCKGIIPLADYYKMELNDIVEWRGNSYHLRAINNYDLKSGNCEIQLLGPIIRDTFGVSLNCAFDFTSEVVTIPPTTTATPTVTPTTLTPTTLTPTVTPTITPTTTTTGGATLSWTYAELNGGNGVMDIYVNGIAVVSRSTTSSGTYPVNVGDVIYCEINTTGCSEPNEYANSYCTGLITDASCDLSVTFLSSYTYTVVSGDVGNTLTLAMYSTCDSGCV